MLLDLDISDPRLAVALAQMMHDLTEVDGPNKVREFAKTLRPGLVSSNWSAADDFVPIQMYLVWADRSITLIGGASRMSHATHYTDALNAIVAVNNVGGANPYLILAAGQTLARLQTDRGLGTFRQFFVGHSLGGAIATAMKMLGASLPGARNAQVVTFGAPKVGPYGASLLIYSGDIIRWMNDTDPVPIIPPHFDQAKAFYATIAAGARQTALSYVQCAGGAVLADGGTVRSLDVPDFTTVNLDLSLAGWLINTVGGGYTGHGMPTYLLRLTQRVALFSGNPPQTHTTRRPERPDIVGSRFLRLEAEAIAAQLRALTREGNVPQVRIPELFAFVAKKLGSIWVVQLREQTVTAGPTRKAARSLAKWGNGFLNRLQTQGRVDIDTLTSSLARYLADASDPESGFVPTMRT